jgi:transcriptional regulator with XRE-family HTH domain
MPLIKDTDLPFTAARTAERLGELVSAARRSRGWTQADLAAKAEVSVSTLYAAERGDARIALQHWLRLLWATDQLDRIAAAIDPAQDEQGVRAMLSDLPRRVRRSRA